MIMIPSSSSVSEASSPSALMSESSLTSDSNTMAGAISLPASSSSISSEESPTSVVNISASIATTEASTIGSLSSKGHSLQPELARIQVLEKKRLALRHQRFSLEQRLYEFCGKHAEGTTAPTPSRHVLDFPWKDKSSGIRVVYSGPLSELEEPHGNDGIMKFSDGQVYRGDVRNGYRWGNGTNSWPDGQDYTGEWTKNSRNGRGTHMWPDGRKVSGNWKDGHLNGKVYFSWPNGATYDGQCRMGKKHGRGVHTWADGRVYSGSFENGKENGFGTLSHPDGVKYRGQFAKGVKEGYGIMLWKTRTYDGEWIKNKPHGQGRVVWSNGATYTGQFWEGKYHGLGVYVWPSGKKFVGRWENGVKNGHGLYTWPNGKKYDGEYKSGSRDGYGRMTWPDGSNYCGRFKDNMRCGRGVQTGPDGQVIHCGQWKDDSPVLDANGHLPMSEKRDSTDSTIPTDISVKKDILDTSLPGTQAEFSLRGQGAGQTSGETKQRSLHASRISLPEKKSGLEHDICSPQMIADLDDDDSCDLGGLIFEDNNSMIKTLSPARLVV